MSTDNHEPTGNELAINDDSLNVMRNYFDSMLQSSQQWIEWANKNQDNPEAVQEASVVISQNIDEMRAHIEVTLQTLGKAVRVIAGATEAVKEAINQRDQAVDELTAVKAETEEKVREAREQAYDNGYSDGQDEIELDPYWVDEVIGEEMEMRQEAIANDVDWVASILRQRGEAATADEIENAYRLSKEMEQKTEELLDRAHGIINRNPLPIILDDEEDGDDQDEVA